MKPNRDETCAEWGRERDRPVIRPWRELRVAVAWVLGILLGVSLLSWWITGEPPFQAHAETRVEPPGYIFGDSFEDWCCGPIPLPCEDDPSCNGGEGPDPCDDPLVMPEGWSPVHMTWEQCFTARNGRLPPTYPQSNGFPVPLGANKGEYRTCSFKALPDLVTNLYWEQAQSNPPMGYGVARTSQSMFIGVSACRGDFRMVPGCSLVSLSGSIVTSTRHAGPSSFFCPLIAGGTYYYTIAPVDPRDGLTPGEDTCTMAPSSTLGCDVQGRQTTN